MVNTLFGKNAMECVNIFCVYNNSILSKKLFPSSLPSLQKYFFGELEELNVEEETSNKEVMHF